MGFLADGEIEKNLSCSCVNNSGGRKGGICFYESTIRGLGPSKPVTSVDGLRSGRFVWILVPDFAHRMSRTLKYCPPADLLPKELGMACIFSFCLHHLCLQSLWYHAEPALSRLIASVSVEHEGENSSTSGTTMRKRTPSKDTHTPFPEKKKGVKEKNFQSRSL
ncbi:hypothetical protein CEXT_60121 [Caerostris extrusa]|uniref:Uncharacterized protein n=1 Tax=Caerostris extrusa TaxID=172846 RepID=A0AAV4YBA0_CAEEX|nr:hypothetical protein CEXT_60121 [Caerostris extrusa]